MAQFNKLTMTNVGKQLQAKAQTGVQLKFTRVAVGDGYLPQGQTLEALTGLISEKKSLDIASMEITGDGTSRVRTTITNSGLATGFYIREIGLFAQDPDAGEILYCVANAADLADYLPAGTGVNVVESTIDLITVVGEATNVTAVINDTLTYITVSDYNEKVGDVSQLSTGQVVAELKSHASDLADIVTVNVRSFGAKGNANFSNPADNKYYENRAGSPGSYVYSNEASDDTNAIKNAIASIVMSTGYGVVLLPDSHRITDTIELPNNIVLIQENSQKVGLRYNGARINDKPILKVNSYNTIRNISIDVPWETFDTNNQLIGILLYNSYNSKLEDICVTGIEKGIYLLGDNSGCGYNQINFRQINTCLYDIYLYAKGADGWVNENTFMAGRIALSSERYTVNSYGIYIDSESSHQPNNNKFFGQSIEGVGVGVFCAGIYNTFLALRTELDGNICYKFADTNDSTGSYQGKQNNVISPYGYPIIVQPSNVANYIQCWTNTIPTYFPLFSPNVIDFRNYESQQTGTPRIIFPHDKFLGLLDVEGAFGGTSTGFFYQPPGDANYPEGVYWLTDGTKRLRFYNGGISTVDNNKFKSTVSPTNPDDLCNKSYADAHGTTASRPTSPDIGQKYFDTTLNKPIWYNGSNWVDATGSTV